MMIKRETCGIKRREIKMNELKVNFENLTEEERAMLLNLVEKANKPKSKVWKPENEEKYYYNYNSATYYDIWTGAGIDDMRYSIGNIFKTEKEAQEAVERLKIRAELQRYADEYNDKPIDWEDQEQQKWYIYFNYSNKKLEYWSFYGLRNAFQISFTSEEVAKAAVQAVDEERIKKYLFGVEE